MAAYAALVSLMHTIEQLQNHHCPPISLEKSQVEYLTENISFFLDFLEGCTCSHGGDTKESDDLKNQIADAAHAVEDLIESHIVDQIFEDENSLPRAANDSRFFQSVKNRIQNSCCFFRSVNNREENVCTVDLNNGLHDMDLIKQEVMQIKEKALFQDHLQRKKKTLSASEDSLGSSFTSHNIVVGFDDELIEIMDKLTGPQTNRQIIPIVGMGGIGKTTLAKYVYSNSLIQRHFDICAWTTISQEYIQEILREVFSQVNKGSSVDESELGVTLHKHLTGRRYLIVMDDMWSIEVWDHINLFLPDNDNGSRILLTTRQSNLASQVTDSYRLHMKFLDVDKSWNLFCEVVFGKEGCPLKFQKTGKKIARGCRGLPLSISVIGGLLAKSKCDREYWEYIAENLNSVVNLEENERCLKILHMSYNELPANLKPCFLFLGIFPEDHKIRVSTLIELWVAEGFLKPVSGKSLEEVATENFKGLVDKNLILVNELGSTGSVKYCNIHDLLRDFCLRQAQNERFYNIMKPHNLNVRQGTTPRRVVFPMWPSSTPEGIHHFDSPSIKVTRSLFYCSWDSPSLQDFRLLRTCNRFGVGASLRYSSKSNTLGNMLHLVNLRYFSVTAHGISSFSSSIYRFWNLHTIIVEHTGIMIAPSEIWKMPQLQSVRFDMVELPDPPMDGKGIVLRNLHTLSTVRNFKCSEEIIKRIPNIKKLKTNFYALEGQSRYVFSFLDRLHTLESFSGTFLDSFAGSYQDLTFSRLLKKLTIEYFHPDDGILEKIGSLPFLEKLKLIKGCFHENKWETVEGQFCSLKSLLIEELSFNLEYWRTESSHFPRLERLVLEHLHALRKIPLEIGDIPTLQSIHLRYCSGSAVASAKRILDEQKELGNEELQIYVHS